MTALDHLKAYLLKYYNGLLFIAILAQVSLNLNLSKHSLDRTSQFQYRSGTTADGFPFVFGT